MSKPVIRLSIELDDVEPRVWRRVDAPVEMSLTGLHDVIQAVMRWDNDHLWEFRIRGRSYADPLNSIDFPLEDADGNLALDTDEMSLRQLAEQRVRKLTYIYDFGDDWRCTVRLQGRRDADPGVDYPVLVDGARRAPPDDFGGAWTFMSLLEAIADPQHPRYNDLLERAGGEFDPDDMNQDNTKFDLAVIVARF